MTEDTVVTTDLSQLTDEQIMELDPGDIVVGPDAELRTDDGAEDGDPAPKTDEDESKQDNPDDDTDGADADEDSSDDTDDSDTPDADDQGSDGDPDGDDDKKDDVSDDDQSDDKDDSDDSEDDPDDDEQNYEAMYNQLMAPFRAAKREIKLDNVEDARRLLKMGVDYSMKMQKLKPQLRTLRTLEKAGLTDPSRINFLIDLEKKDPVAIKRLLKDSGIDPMTLNLEGSEDYVPTDHAPGDAESNVRDVLDDIKDDEGFDKTYELITKGLDKASKIQLQESPETIAQLHDHIQAGVYDKVQERVANEKMLGRLTGLSDLQAYYKVGDVMYKAGEFADVTTDSTNKDSGTSQASGSEAAKAAAEKAKAKKAETRKRKRAAKVPKGRPAKPGKKRPDFSKMTDEEVEALDVKAF